MSMRTIANVVNRLSRIPVVMLVIAGLLLSSCAAVQAPAVPGNFLPPVDMAIVSVQVKTVAYGIGQCLKDAAGTQILVNGEQIVFAWGYEWGSVGLFGIDLKNKSLMDLMAIAKQGGGLTNAKTAGDLVRWMQANGWTAVSGAALAESMKTSLLAFLEGIASSPLLALYMILPVDSEGNYDPNQLPGLAPSIDS